MNATLETVYFNGMTYRKLVQPVKLETQPDDNNTPETAQEIQKGTHNKNFLGDYDLRDFYKIWLINGQSLNVQAWSESSPAPVCELTVYDDGMNVKAFNNTIDSDKKVTFTADSTGFWLIEINSVSPAQYWGFYSIDVNS
jgi:hypothetical protein